MFQRKFSFIIFISLSWSNNLAQSNLPFVEDNSSDWEHLLRELIFKTISPPPPRNTNLYKQILTAPFYKGPVKTSSLDGSATLLSQGDVFLLPDHGWILCQEGCVNCDECESQENPTVRWILRRIKRSGSRYDLQLTIVPQTDDSFHMRNLALQSFVYVITDSKDKRSTNNVQTDKEIDSLEYRPNPSGQSDNFDLLLKRSNQDKELYISEDDLKIVDISEIGSILDGISNTTESFDSRVILGTDHSGTKYLVQIVQADDVEKKVTPTSSPNPVPRMERAISSSGSYQNVLQRVIISLNTHRKFIENFLTSDQKSPAISSSKLFSRNEEQGKSTYSQMDNLDLANIYKAPKEVNKVNHGDVRNIVNRKKLHGNNVEFNRSHGVNSDKSTGDNLMKIATGKSVGKLDGDGVYTKVDDTTTEVTSTVKNIKRRISRFNNDGYRNGTDMNVKRLNKSQGRSAGNITFGYFHR